MKIIQAKYDFNNLSTRLKKRVPEGLKTSLNNAEEEYNKRAADTAREELKSIERCNSYYYQPNGLEYYDKLSRKQKQFV